MVALVAEDGGGRSGHGLMVAIVTEDGGGESFVGDWHPRHLSSFGGRGAGMWASLSWYIVVAVWLFATSLAMMWHLGSEQ